MDRTRLSLFYVATYLWMSGLGLALAPGLALKLMFSNGQYEPLFVRFGGVLLIGLAILVVQVIRHRLSVLYPTLIWVRVLFCLGWLWLYSLSSDPFFLVVLAIVGLGLVVSSLAYFRDRRTAGAAALLACALAVPGLGAPARAADAPPVFALHCGHLIDTVAGKKRGETTVLIEGSKIKEVVAGKEGVKGATDVDLLAQTCLPGLIDSHAHLSMQISATSYLDKVHWNVADYAVRSTVYAERTLLAGFTTVRNLGDEAGETIALRNAVNTGMLSGPRIFTAAQPIGSTGGHADPTDGFRFDLAGDPGPLIGVINSAEDAWKAVRQHYKEGADLIKIMPSGGVLDESSSADNPQMTIEEISAVVAAAHDYGFTVAAHAHGAEAIRRAVLGGVDSIEHGTFMNEEDMKLMKKHGTWYVPTIIAGRSVADNAKIPGFFPPQVASKAASVGTVIQATAGKAYRAGVKIAFGTDAGVYPHGENAREFGYLVEAGLSPMEAIQAATTHAAELLKREKELGSLAAGKWADVVAVPGDPLADVGLLQHVSFVMKNGDIYKRP